MMDFITTYVISPTAGGVSISYGALFMGSAWVLTSWFKRMVTRKVKKS